MRHMPIKWHQSQSCNGIIICSAAVVIKLKKYLSQNFASVYVISTIVNLYNKGRPTCLFKENGPSTCQAFTGL